MPALPATPKMPTPQNEAQVSALRQQQQALAGPGGRESTNLDATNGGKQNSSDAYGGTWMSKTLGS
jgi:hypothetical protein